MMAAHPACAPSDDQTLKDDHRGVVHATAIGTKMAAISIGPEPR